MKNTLFILALFIGLSSYCQIPSYYNDNTINFSLSGQSLLNELANKITATHTSNLSYTPGVWTALQQADLNPNNSTEVVLIYGYNDTDSDQSNNRTREAANIDSSGTSTTEFWNREHVFPRSLGNPNLGSTGPGSDAHHIRPSDPSTNSTRSNRIFANGSGNSGTTSNGHWYPGDEWKGDIARMIMYMYLRYGDRCLPTAVGDGDRLSTDSNMIDLFLAWNIEDPVSNFETNRNDIIEDIQGNRNPFIDNPAFATSIWGGDQAEDLFGTEVPTEGSTASLIISEYIEGTSNNKAIEIANISGSSVSLSNYSLKKQTNGSGSWSSGLNLSGTLSSGSVHVIVNNLASTTLLAFANTITNSTVVSFNGNDPVGLFYKDTLIDVVGTFGGGSSNFATNQTLVRNTNVNTGITNYTSSQWQSFSVDTYSNLGAHNASANTNASISTTLSITFDNYSGETSWEILDSSHTVVNTGRDYTETNGTTIKETMSLPAGCYTLNFYDSYGDGICCTQGNGSYNLTNNTTGNTLTSGGAFRASTTKDFCLSSSASKTVVNETIETPQNSFELALYPNPTIDIIYFTTKNQLTNTRYHIFNETGAEVKNGINTDNSVSVEELAAGLYFIEVNGLPARPFIKN